MAVNKRFWRHIEAPTAASFLLCGSLWAQSTCVSIDQTIINTARVTDQGAIAKIIQISLLPEDADSVKAIVFFDVNNNGFGYDDFVRIEPSGHSYALIRSPELQEIIESWCYVEATELYGSASETPELLESYYEPDPQKKAANFILANLLRGINNNYNALPMNLYFKRDSTGTYEFKMWGFDTSQGALSWRPPKYPPGGFIKDYDIFRVHRTDRDTLFISNTTLYDQIYIYHQVTDTVYLAPESLLNPAWPAGSNYLPGLLPPGQRRRQ